MKKAFASHDAKAQRVKKLVFRHAGRLSKNRRSKETAPVGVCVYDRGRLTPTAKAGVSQKRSSDSLNPLLTLFRRNTLLRPADFFDSLSLRISRCEGFFSCFYQLLEHLAAFLEVFEDAVAGGGR